MENSEINPLLIEIHDLIKLSLNDSISLVEKKNEYKTLLAKYKRLELENISQESNGFIKGLLYHHNIDNFSKSTFIFKKNDSGFSILEQSGDNNLLLQFNDKIIDAISNTFTGEIYSKLLNKKDNLNLKIYINKLFSHDNNLFIATITSSHYFKIKIFEVLSNITKKLFMKNFQRNSPISFNYFDEISNGLTNFINECENENLDISVFYFKFENFNKTFGEISISTSIDISRAITSGLKNSFSEEYKIFIYTINDYIIIKPEEKLKEDIFENISLRSNIEFIYNSIEIPCKSKHFIINNDNASIYDFWNKILSFKNFDFDKRKTILPSS